MSTKLRNLIILVVVITLLFVLYKIFVTGKPKTSSQLTSLNQSTVIDTKTLAEGQEFLNNLNILKNITLDNSMFNNNNEAFVKLIDYSVDIGHDTNPGRLNPFAPLGVDVVAITPNTLNGEVAAQNPNAQALSIQTQSAIEVGRISAKLRGAIPKINEGDLSYFEWGTDITNLSFSSSPYHQIVSPFAYIAQSLSPRTKYYFRTVIKNGDTIVNGEIMSFTTLN